MTPQELKQQARKDIDEKTVGELNFEYATKDIWEVLPFTKGVIERNTKTKEDADCIIKKVAEHHREVVNILTSIIDRTVQMTEERIAQNVKSELRLWSGFGEYYGNATRFANSILSLITSKSDTNKSEESGSYKKGLLDAIKLVCICKGTIVDLNCPHNKIAMRLMDVEFGTEDTEENELILASKKQAFKRRGK